MHKTRGGEDVSTGERQREIIRILLGKSNYMSMGEIAKRVGASERTIRRDIDILTSEYPLTTSEGRYGGVKFIDGYRPHRNLLSRERESALKSAISKVDSRIGVLLEEILHEFGS